MEEKKEKPISSSFYLILFSMILFISLEKNLFEDMASLTNCFFHNYSIFNPGCYFYCFWNRYQHVFDFIMHLVLILVNLSIIEASMRYDD